MLPSLHKRARLSCFHYHLVPGSAHVPALPIDHAIWQSKVTMYSYAHNHSCNTTPFHSNITPLSLHRTSLVSRTIPLSGSYHEHYNKSCINMLSHIWIQPCHIHAIYIILTKFKHGICVIPAIVMYAALPVYYYHASHALSC